MKILHTADWHVGKSLKNRSRADEHRAVLKEIATVAANEEVDLVIVAGDVFEASAPTPEAEEIVYQALLDLAVACPEVIVAGGNHDNPSRLKAVAPVFDQLRVRVIPSPFSNPSDGALTVKTRSGETARAAVVPFLSQRHVLTADELMKKEGSELVQDYSRICRRYVELAVQGMDESTINLAIAHMFLLGGKKGGGERSAQTSEAYWVQPLIFQPPLQYVALGHLHGCQKIHGACPMWYSGSPLQLDFGEESAENAVLLVEVSASEPAEVNRVALRSGRKLITLHGTRESLEASEHRYSEALLRIYVTEQNRPGLNEEVREMFPNAIEVRIEHEPEVTSDEHLQMPQLSEAELFSLYLKEADVKADELAPLFAQLVEEIYASGTT